MTTETLLLPYTARSPLGYAVVSLAAEDHCVYLFEEFRITVVFVLMLDDGKAGEVAGRSSHVAAERGGDKVEAGAGHVRVRLILNLGFSFSVELKPFQGRNEVC